jgi:hypothetical protein
MMKIFTFLFLIVFGFSSLSAQERYLKPVDEAKTDASFLAFRTKLIEAAKKRDAKYILGVVDRDIKNSFGGNDGIEEFMKAWKINSPDSEFWNEFFPVITNGGTFFKKGKTKIFFAPYSFNAFPDDLDAFSYSVIFGNNVNLRLKADNNSPVIASLSYNIVEIVNSINSGSNSEKVSWYEVKTLGGKKGFVSADYVRSPIDYRAGFEKIKGKWKMTIFLAGD